MDQIKQSLQEIIISEKKMKIFSFIMIILFTVFAFSIVGIANNNNDKQIKEYQNTNKTNIELEKVAVAQRNAFLQKTIALEKELSGVKGELKENTKLLNKFENSYQGSMIILKQYKNETNYVPNDVPVGEQSVFLSNHIYKPY